jgi:sialate O-acetylesterase
VVIEIHGLRDHQVVQRTTPTSAPLVLGGTSEGPIRLRVVDPAGRPVTEWEEAGPGGQWKADLTVPIGGPYDVLAQDGDAAPQAVARHVLVGDLWLLAGQSNMQGCGLLGPDVEAPCSRVSLLDMTRQWRPAVDPLHRLHASPDLVHNTTDDAAARAVLVEAEVQAPVGAGLGVPFANGLAADAGVPIGLIATAHGGTSLRAWSPELREAGGESLFGSMALSLEAAGGRIAGALWYQGESDALDLDSDGFADRLRGFVAALREEVADPDLPFFHVQISRVTELPGIPDGAVHHWNAVREAQRTTDLGPGAMTTAVDLALTDFTHISTLGLGRLGRRLALLASGRATTIEIERVEALITRGAIDDIPELFELRVRLAGIAVPLAPREHIAGFSLRSTDGVAKPWIYAVAVDATDPATIVINGIGNLGEGDTLSYGYGFDPYCNLVDAQDMAVPAFGPVRLAPTRLAP